VISRPQSEYRKRLLAKVVSLNPARVLEAGSGAREFLRSTAAAGIDVRGLDPDESSFTALRREGFAVTQGVANALPFEEDAFALVVFCYTSRHVADWQRAGAEATRVASRAVLVLDPWYETSIPSQVIAEKFDRWAMAIDRSRGMVHNDCLNAAEIFRGLARGGRPPIGRCCGVRRFRAGVERPDRRSEGTGPSRRRGHTCACRALNPCSRLHHPNSSARVRVRRGQRFRRYAPHRVDGRPAVHTPSPTI
jgi:hypothetical protein